MRNQRSARRVVRRRAGIARQTRNDRQIFAPSAVGRVVRSGMSGDRVPSMRSRGRGMNITHCERMATVTTASTALEVRSYNLNPGLCSCTPWLADVANRFDKYKFRTVAFRYVPSSAANAGNMAMAFDFDVNDAPPATMNEATTFHDYVETSIWHEATLRLDLASGDKLPQKSTRPGVLAGDFDLSNYDVGTLHIMTEGAAAGVIGYVEIMYTVDLFVHQTQNGVGGRVNSSTSLDATHLFGASVTYDPHGVFPGAVTATNVFTFTQPFEGVVSFRMAGTVMTGDVAGNISASPGLCYATIGFQLANAASTAVIGWMYVRAAVGSTLTPTMTATTVTSSYWLFSRGAYNAY